MLHAHTLFPVLHDDYLHTPSGGAGGGTHPLHAPPKIHVGVLPLPGGGGGVGFHFGSLFTTHAAGTGGDGDDGVDGGVDCDGDDGGDGDGDDGDVMKRG